MILVLDNYDSFVYNLVHLVHELGFGDKTDVFRNDKISLEEVEKYDKILLSPGPGLPSEAGIMPELIQKYAPTKQILGVCLGHQAIAEAFGAQLFNLPTVLHGMADKLHVEDKEALLFKDLPTEFQIGHYHSWVVMQQSMNENEHLVTTATDETGNIMALRHKTYDVRGVQFHPESILTEHGAEMMKRWLTH